MAGELSRRDFLRRAKGVALTAPFLGLVACDRPGDRRRGAALAGPTMGTVYNVRITDFPSKLDRRGFRAEVDRVLETVNRQMSNWRADSELSQFNAAAASAWIGISDDARTVIDEARRIGRLTGGAFDPTIGALVDLWGFGPGSAERRVPSKREIAAARERTGFRHVRTRAARSAVAKQRGGIEIDLSGIAKGFGVDQVARFLESEGIADYLVEIGGELRARGLSSRRQAWRIGVERPVVGRRAVQRIVALDDGAIATSGNYRNFFERAGSHYSHIIDPATGAPVRHALASVTVIAPSTIEADALSTALMVLGPDAGFDLARRERLAAWFMVTGDRGGDRGGDKGLIEFGSPEFDRFRRAQGAAS